MILDDIVNKVLGRLSERKRSVSLQDLNERVLERAPARDFAQSIRRGENEKIRVIAEVKKASPSKGLLRKEFDPVKIALEYEEYGASAVSVLTEEDFFLGHPDYLRRIREAVGIPLLRKDFILDPYQVVEARALGADSFLLIMSLLADDVVQDLISLGRELGMTALVEVHSEEEMDRALHSPAQVIGINNRNLSTFVTDIENTLHLMQRGAADRIVVSESGIQAPGDLRRLERAGVDAVLVGETLIRARQPGVKLRELLDY